MLLLTGGGTHVLYIGHTVAEG